MEQEGRVVSECVVRMEMPLNCLECPMYDWNRRKLCCNAHLDLRPIPNGGVPKPDWCPIVCSLPDGHGRLGDLDELERKMNGARIRVMQDGQDTNPYWECGDIIASEKTIVPAERREE